MLGDQKKRCSDHDYEHGYASLLPPSVKGIQRMRAPDAHQIISEEHRLAMNSMAEERDQEERALLSQFHWGMALGCAMTFAGIGIALALYAGVSGLAGA